MDKVGKLELDQRKELFEAASGQLGITPAVVEKDFWVCWTLKRLFASETVGRKILFKGGTSLSKVFRLIERFSEDIDLILDWNELNGADPEEPRSKTKQDQFNKQIQHQAADYLSGQFLQEVREALEDLCNAEIEPDDPSVISIRYPAAFAETYLRPEIRLEIGPLAQWVPNDDYVITPYAAEMYSNYFDDPNCPVRAIKAERTFWEKVTILHHEANRPSDQPQPPRYSRHYYDLARMAESEVRASALQKLDLLDSVVRFKQKFYPRGWARFEEAKPGTLRLVPPNYRLHALQSDYRNMGVMIFGKIPTFERIVTVIQDLENEMNQLEKGA